MKKIIIKLIIIALLIGVIAYMAIQESIVKGYIIAPKTCGYAEKTELPDFINVTKIYDSQLANKILDALPPDAPRGYPIVIIVQGNKVLLFEIGYRGPEWWKEHWKDGKIIIGTYVANVTPEFNKQIINILLKQQDNKNINIQTCLQP